MGVESQQPSCVCMCVLWAGEQLGREMKQWWAKVHKGGDHQWDGAGGKGVVSPRGRRQVGGVGPPSRKKVGVTE